MIKRDLPGNGRVSEALRLEIMLMGEGKMGENTEECKNKGPDQAMAKDWLMLF